MTTENCAMAETLERDYEGVMGKGTNESGACSIEGKVSTEGLLHC